MGGASRAAAWTVLVLLIATSLLVAPPAGAESDEFPQCAAPPLDVLFLFDTTGSMGGEISDAQDGASQVMNNVLSQAPNARFGVAHYEDYPGSFSYPGYSNTYGSSGNVPWALVQGLTMDTAAVQNAIDSLSAFSGADYPESVSRAVHEVRHLGWRTNSVRVVVQFGDAPPHDLDFNGQNTGGDPGPDATAQTADDLDFETEVAQAAADDIRFVTINSGGTAAEAWFRYLADQTGGRYAELSGDFVGQVTDLILDFVPQPRLRARSAAVSAELSVPANPRIDVLPTQVTADGTDHKRLAHQPIAPLNGYVTTVDDGSSGTEAPGQLTSRGNVTITEFSLLGGTIQGRGLHGVAEARTVAGSSSADGDKTRIAEITVNGNTFAAPVPKNTIVPIPGVGVAILNESRTRTVGAQAAEQLVNLVHVVVDNAQMRGDIVVGHAYAATTCGPDVGALLSTQDNDAGSGGDAGDTPGSATPIAAPALVQGRTLGDDGVDFYAVSAAPGEKIEAAVLPSSRAEVAVEPLGTAPGLGASLPDLDLYLREPGTFRVREQSTLPLSAPDRVELNVDQAGPWILEVRRPAGAPEGNYTLGVSVTPIALLPQNDALQPGDAGDSCRTSRTISQGVHPGVLKGPDRSDWFDIDADIGDDLAFAVKPTEDADGADFDLFLYDGSCNPLLGSSLGKGLVPKGTADFVGPIPAPATQTYHVEVRRINGIGNYYLTAIAQDPQPTVSPIDAESGGDAGASQSGANPVQDPSVNQGRFPDGDGEDWYSFPADAGDRITATLKPSELSDADLYLVRPDGTVATSSTLTSSLPDAVQHVAGQTGTWYLRIVRQSGGGDYLFTVATESLV